MDRLDHQVSYWNGVGSTKEFGHPLNINRLRGEMSPDGRMLDFGCGYGRVSAALFDAEYWNVVGVDPSPMMVAKARESYPSMTFLQVDPARLPFADGAFDTVLLFTVFTCVPTDDGQLGLVAEARRVLRDNGLLYVSDLWLQRDARDVARYERFRTKYSRYGVFELPEGVVLRHHDRAWIVRLTAAFELLALDEIVVRTMNGHPAEAFQWFGPKKPTDGLTTAYGRTGGQRWFVAQEPLHKSGVISPPAAEAWGVGQLYEPPSARQARRRVANYVLEPRSPDCYSRALEQEGLDSAACDRRR